MDVINQAMRRGIRTSANVLFNFTPLRDDQKLHLTKVYASLLSNVLMTAIGVYSQLYVFPLPVWLAIIGKLYCIFSLASSSTKVLGGYNSVLTSQRGLYFGGIGYLTGVILAEYMFIIHMYVGTSIIPTAFFSSLAVFTCFSVSALLAKQRHYLYLGGILSSAIFYLSLASLVQLFWRTKLLNDFLVWGGLLMYLGFILYDTQITIMDYDYGNKDYLIHAVQFYADLVGLFIHIVQILSEKEQRENRRKRRDDD